MVLYVGFLNAVTACNLIFAGLISPHSGPSTAVGVAEPWFFWPAAFSSPLSYPDADFRQLFQPQQAGPVLQAVVRVAQPARHPGSALCR